MAPVAVDTTMDLMVSSESDRTRLDAASSILDRGGAPRRKESRVDIRTEFVDSFAEVIDVEAVLDLDDE